MMNNSEHLAPLDRAVWAMGGQCPEPLHAIAWALIALAQSVDSGAAAAFDVARAATEFFTNTSPDSFALLQEATKQFIGEND